MRNRSIALAIAIGLFRDGGPDAASRIALGRPVQVPAGAGCPRWSDRRFGAPGHVAIA